MRVFVITREDDDASAFLRRNLFARRGHAQVLVGGRGARQGLRRRQGMSVRFFVSQASGLGRFWPFADRRRAVFAYPSAPQVEPRPPVFLRHDPTPPERFLIR